MPNIGAVLKDEIARISRKEIRKATDPLRRVTAAQRHEIAALKRQLAAAERQVRSLSRHLPHVAAVAAVAATPAEPSQRITSKGIASLRSRLGLSAEKFGLLAGVSGQTVYHWEGGAKPRRAQLATLIGLKGLSKQAATERLEQLSAKPKRRRK